MGEEPRPAPDDDRGRPVRHAPPLLVRLVRTDAVSAVLPPRKEREGRSRDQGSSSTCGRFFSSRDSTRKEAAP